MRFRSVIPEGLTPAETVVLHMIEAVNERRFDALDALIAPDVVRHCAATPDVDVRSLEEFKACLHRDLAAVPDAHQELNLIFSHGPLVAAHVTYSGTQDGQMGPFPPSGRKLEIPFIGILRVADGKIAEIWVEWDNLNALTQLGHFPSEATGE
jgi:predicted ester cyclase